MFAVALARARVSRAFRPLRRRAIQHPYPTTIRTPARHSCHSAPGRPAAARAAISHAFQSSARMWAIRRLARAAQAGILALQRVEAAGALGTLETLSAHRKEMRRQRWSPLC